MLLLNPLSWLHLDQIRKNLWQRLSNTDLDLENFWFQCQYDKSYFQKYILHLDQVKIPNHHDETKPSLPTTAKPRALPSPRANFVMLTRFPLRLGVRLSPLFLVRAQAYRDSQDKSRRNPSVEFLAIPVPTTNGRGAMPFVCVCYLYAFIAQEDAIIRRKAIFSQ